MQKHLRILAISLCFVGTSLPLAAQDTAPVSPETVVASVNGEDITIGHMIAARATLPEQYAQIPAEELYNGILQQLIQQTALAQQTSALPAMVARTLENEHRSLKAAQTIEMKLETAISDAEIQAAYDEQYGDLDPQEEFNASHILVATEEEALAIVEELAGGADFAATARTKSTGPSGPNGGELGWFGTGMMVPDFEAATIALGLGEVSAPVQTQFGWHVIRLNDTRKAEIPTLEMVRPQIAETLRQAKAREIVENSTVGADVKIPELEALDPEILTQTDLLDQ